MSKQRAIGGAKRVSPGGKSAPGIGNSFFIGIVWTDSGPEGQFANSKTCVEPTTRGRRHLTSRSHISETIFYRTFSARIECFGKAQFLFQLSQESLPADDGPTYSLPRYQRLLRISRPRISGASVRYGRTRAGVIRRLRAS